MWLCYISDGHIEDENLCFGAGFGDNDYTPRKGYVVSRDYIGTFLVTHVFLLEDGKLNLVLECGEVDEEAYQVKSRWWIGDYSNKVPVVMVKVLEVLKRCCREKEQIGRFLSVLFLF